MHELSSGDEKEKLYNNRPLGQISLYDTCFILLSSQYLLSPSEMS
jgi:hypothetical protein